MKISYILFLMAWFFLFYVDGLISLERRQHRFMNMNIMSKAWQKSYLKHITPKTKASQESSRMNKIKSDVDNKSRNTSHLSKV